MLLRLLLISTATALLPSLSLAPANANQEMNEGDFLDLVDAKGNVTVQGNGVSGVNAKASAQGLNLQHLGTGLLKDIALSYPLPALAMASLKG